MSKELTEAKRRAIKKYDAANTRQIHLKLNTNTDADILEHLDGLDNVQGYIKRLIRLDMGMKSLVRCKDCKRRGTYGCPVYVGGDGMCSEPDDWFCADGEHK